MLLDHRFCLTTLVASNHEPGVTLRAIANNGRLHIQNQCLTRSAATR